jgi:hypothetical protein
VVEQGDIDLGWCWILVWHATSSHRCEGAWQRITGEQPRYAGYQQKADRVLPVIRLPLAEAMST